MIVELRYCTHCLLVSVDGPGPRPKCESLGFTRGEGGCLGASGGRTPGTQRHDWQELGSFQRIEDEGV